MRVLEYNVSGQKLEAIGNHDNVVKGSRNYIKAKFKLNDKDWDGCSLAAEFIIGRKSIASEVDKDFSCFVPDKACDSFYYKVRLHGKRGLKKITTNCVIERQV